MICRGRERQDWDRRIRDGMRKNRADKERQGRGRERQDWDGRDRNGTGKKQCRIVRDRIVDGKDGIGDGRDRNGTGNNSAE
jgi:hypothetical protein